MGKKTQHPPETVVVHGIAPFGKEYGACDASPFVVKLQVWMALAGIPSAYIGYKDHGMKKAPKGKVPFILHKEKYIPDSTYIVEYLTKEFDIHLDDHLTPEDHALGHCIKRMIEENIYWSSLIYPRWVSDEGWAICKPEFAAALGFGGFLGSIVMPFARSPQIKASKAHGMGRRTPQEAEKNAIRDLTSLSGLIKGKEFVLGGDKPTSYDATVYGFLHAIVCRKELNHMPAAKFVLEDEVLRSYVERMSEIVNARKAELNGDDTADAGTEGDDQGDSAPKSDEAGEGEGSAKDADEDADKAEDEANE